MFDWLRSLRRRSSAPEHGKTDEAEEEQRRQFSEWESAMQEVSRVQDVAAGKPPSRQRPHAHR